MINTSYFRILKKTGSPVETGQPLRLLDMRLFNYLCCADMPAYNEKPQQTAPQRQPFNNSFLDKLTVPHQVKLINLYPKILSLK